MSLYIGISLNDELTDIAVNGDGQQASVPTAVCKEKGKDSWLVGEEAYQTALKGQGSLVDKLTALLRKDGTATIEGKCYSAEELLGHFFRELLTQQLVSMAEKAPRTLLMRTHRKHRTFLPWRISRHWFCRCGSRSRSWCSA